MNIRALTPFGRLSPLARMGADPDFFVGLRREMDRMFDDFASGWGAPTAPAAFLSPKVDIAETEKGLELVAELPGAEAKDIDVDIEDGVLTLKAEIRKESEKSDAAKTYHLVERSVGTFLRRFVLPFAVEEEKIEARFDNGVLTVTVPRRAEAEKKTKKIEVKKAEKA